MIDLSKFPCHKKPYANSTLRQMKKSELIDILRDYEHNSITGRRRREKIPV